MSSSRITCRIDLRELEKNFAVLKEHAGACRVMPVLKYDAYGLGAMEIGRTLAQAGACRFAAATCEEALDLRKLGLDVQILGILPPWEMGDAVANDIICPVESFRTAQLLSEEACRQQKKIRIAVKLDTGMGRLGILPDSAVKVISDIVKLPGLEPDSLFSHFATAAQPDLFFADLQIDRFIAVKNALDKAGIVFPNCHHAAGDAILKLPRAVKEPFNMVRPGGMMYGDDFTGKCRQIIELSAAVGAVRELPPGASIGYYRTFIAAKPLKVAVLTAGYADGIPLALSNRGRVIIRGKYCNIIGRVAMDYTMVDVSDVPDAAAGDEAVLLGKRGELAVTVAEWGGLKNTHGHDIWCAIGHRTTREYIR